MKVINAVWFTFLCLYYVLFCAAHWIFCMKYWVIAIKMETIQAVAPHSNKNFHCILFYGILLLNVVLPIYEAVEGWSPRVKNILLVADWCSGNELPFLFDASRRIIEITRKNSNKQIHVRAMCIHLIAYVLYMISLIQFYFTTILKKYESAHEFFVSLTIRTSFSTLSQVFICDEFRRIHKISQTGQELDPKGTH